MHKNSKKRILLATSFCTIVFLVIIYLCISVFYQYHYLPGTIINGVDVSNETVDSAQDILLDDVRLYYLKIEERYGKEEHIPSADIDMSMSIEGDLNKVKEKQNPYMWFKDGGSHDVTVNVTYDEKKLDDVINKLACLDDEKITGPVAPTVVYENNKFTITEGNPGNELDKKKTKELIKNSINNMDDILNLELSGCYVKELNEDTTEIEEITDKLNDYLDVQITLTFGEKKEVIDGELISEWLTVNNKNKIVFAKKAIKEYLKELANEYDTMGKLRTFKNATGSTITVASGDYGWWLDIDTECKNIINDIKSMRSGSREPAFLQRADVFEEVDFKDNYIEVNLTTQKLYAIKDGEVFLTSDIVSGAPDSSTPTGIYRMRFMFKNYSLKRPNLNKIVDYWMVFYGNTVETNIGLCSCDWLTKFGGKEYLTNGSLGSIYMSEEDAKTIYENYPNDDFAVIIYKD